jgi:heterotetrameric sarcosine oxidase delta subunit
MILIPCPHCGERPETEFTYGGDGTVKRPADPAAADDAAWHAYVYLRANPKGGHTEYWYHQFGCRTWFTLRRDTATHEILPADGEAS